MVVCSGCDGVIIVSYEYCLRALLLTGEMASKGGDSGDEDLCPLILVIGGELTEPQGMLR